MSRPRILISNDDGVNAPGLLALVSLLQQEGFADFAVCGPAGERSAQSHCISIGKHLHAWPIPCPGAVEAWAVDGSPADSVMLALHGPILKSKSFDLVVSGINRGDNCGLHVIYSGTVGAAREAACKGIPSLAFSLDSFRARSEEHYAAAAKLCVALVKAALGLLPGSSLGLLAALKGSLLNVNVPDGELGAIKGYHLAHQGAHCHWPEFQEMEADPHLQNSADHQGSVTLRAFRNQAGYLRTDETPGSDSWAVSSGWVAVTPIGLLSDVPLSAAAASGKGDSALVEQTALALTAAARHLGIQTGGL